MFAAVATVTVDDLIAQVQAAIELGELEEQQVPGGHPLYGAVADARELLGWLVENSGLMASGPGANVQARVQATIGAIYDAAAGIRNDPTSGPAPTVWPQVKALPWPWLAAGAGGLLLVAVLFQQRERRRR